MLYNSTQNAKEVVSAAQAIAQGISKDGGLFVPQEFPKYDENTFKALLKTDYKGRAKKVFSDFLSDIYFAIRLFIVSGNNFVLMLFQIFHSIIFSLIACLFSSKNHFLLYIFFKKLGL